MTTKSGIRNFGKTFAYLKDPEVRQRETGDAPLTVEGALFSGDSFEDIEWRNIDFVNCDFIGAYEIGLNRCIKVDFVDCKFAGVLSLGETVDVRFLRCAWGGQSVMYGEEKSRSTLFESCTFIGSSANKNRWRCGDARRGAVRQVQGEMVQSRWRYEADASRLRA